MIRGLEVVNKFRSELEYLDFARVMDVVEKIEKQGDHFVVQTKGSSSMEARAVILATGVQQSPLDVPGEKEFMGKGLGYSALSYAPLFIDKNVIVIGNGELALRSAGELATVAKQVTVVCECDKSMETPLAKKLMAAGNVTIIQSAQVVEVKGDQYAHTLVVKDAAGKVAEYKTDGIFVEKSLAANASMVEGLVPLNERGRITVDGSCRTSVPGLFAAGDVTDTGAEQVLIAIGEGAKAALSAYDYLLPFLA